MRAYRFKRQKNTRSSFDARCDTLGLCTSGFTDDVMFLYNGTYKWRMGTALCTSSPVAAGGAQSAVGGQPASSQTVLLPRRPRTRDVARAMASVDPWGRLSDYVSS